MADEERVESGTATAVADRPDVEDAAPTPPTADGKKKRKKKKDDDDDLEYEVEFATPFGKLEFEFEPLDKKAKKDAERKAKAERAREAAAAKKAMELAKAAERASKSERGTGGGGPSRLLITLLVIGIVGGAIIIAYWLFARPGADDEDAIPPEFANKDIVDEPEPVAQGFVARARGRVSDAIRAGRRASRDAQREQREKFERMTGSRASD